MRQKEWWIMKYEIRESSRHMLNGEGNWLIFNVSENRVSLNNIVCKSVAARVCDQMNGVNDREFINVHCPCVKCI